MKLNYISAEGNKEATLHYATFQSELENDCFLHADIELQSLR